MINIKCLLNLSVLFLGMTIISCSNGNSLSEQQNKEDVNNAINKLYTAFSFNVGQEPDWNQIRHLCLEGATFVSEPEVKVQRHGIDIEEFISDYKNVVENSSLKKTGYHETIIGTNINLSKTVANVEVTFRAFVGSDPRERKTGLDNIQLINDTGEWKIVAFTTQSESKL